MIYGLEKLSYYLGLKPNEFWNYTYREVKLYCTMNLGRIQDDYRYQIILQEAATNKMIQANSLSNGHPKVVSLLKMFPNLFEDK